MRDALLVLWIATLGADRVDLLAGSGPFLLTPFLLLTPIVVAAEVLSVIGRGGRFWMPRGASRYGVAALAFLCLALLSVIFSLEVAIAAKRFALLLIQVSATLFLAVMLANRERPERVLVRGAYAGLAVVFVFNAIQIGMWLAGRSAIAGPTGDVFFLEPWMYGPWVPRLSGPAIDMNRGGLLCLVYLFVLLRFAAPSRVRGLFLTVGVFSMVATLSRSTMLALLVTSAIWFVQRRSFTITYRRILTGSLAIAGILALLLVFVETVVAVAEFLAPALALRVMGDGSSSIHFALLQYGLEVGTESMKHALLGVGFGNSFAVLEEFFPGDKYGNFHSLYLSLWVEMGIFALFLGLLLLVYPFVRSTAYRPLLGGILAFNLFYQATLEPVFWLVLAAAWMQLAAGAAAAGIDARSEPRMARYDLEPALAAG
jgi:hypothetical protein